MDITRTLARLVTKSSLLRNGSELWERNEKDWTLSLSKKEKLLVGIYAILNDYSVNKFPPTFKDQQKAYDAEINYMFSLPGINADEVNDGQMRKPFWFGPMGRKYLVDFTIMTEVFEKLNISPPKRILELGCGPGWMAEFLSLMNFDVVASTISAPEIEKAKTRIESICVKGINPTLTYLASPMETIDQTIQGMELFDAVYIFEALHHAYDWRKSMQSSYNCLKPGGWLIICNEPNVLHTFISYRVARLSNTHEIGLRRSDLTKHLRKTGFQKIIILRNRVGFWIKPHWIAAQRPL